MSMKDRLTRKTEGLVVPGKGEGTASAGPLRTSPGQMLMVNSLMKESNEKIAQLEERLKQFDGVLPVRLLPAEQVMPSRWANQLDAGFDTADFAELRQEIAEAGGNVQPIKVRPVPGDGEKFEIVFGHRRHRACLELGLPVLALIEEVSEVDLFKEMDRENRSRLDLSPWEQGMMYRRALDEKLFASQEQLSRELGVDAGNVSKALKLASLDERIVKAFKSPLDLQYRWAKPLSEALAKDQSGVLAKAKALQKEGGSRSAKDVFAELTETAPAKPELFPIEIDGSRKAVIEVKGEEVVVRFARGAVDLGRLGELEEALVRWMQS